MKKSNNKKHPVSGKSIPPFSYRTEPNYFWAIIGPVDRSELGSKYPNGEGGLRWTLEKSFLQAFPNGYESCSSGWGMTPQMKVDVGYAMYDDDVKKQLIRSYYNEGKPMPRALRAWELLFEEQETDKINNKEKIDKRRKSRNTH